VLIRCAGKTLVPLHSVKWCEDHGDSIVLFVGDRDRFTCHGDDAVALRALVLRPAPAPIQVQLKEEKTNEKHEEARKGIPVLPGRSRR
jgi:hypothetical protein